MPSQTLHTKATRCRLGGVNVVSIFLYLRGLGMEKNKWVVIGWRNNESMKNLMLKLDEELLHHILGLVLTGQVRINADFPGTGGYHFQLGIIEREVDVGGLSAVLACRFAVFHNNFQSTGTVSVDIDRSLLLLVYVLESHLGEIRAVLIDRVSEHEDFHVVAIANYGGECILEQHKLVGEVAHAREKLVEDDGCDTGERNGFVMLHGVQIEGSSNQSRLNVGVNLTILHYSSQREFIGLILDLIVLAVEDFLDTVILHVGIKQVPEIFGPDVLAKTPDIPELLSSLCVFLYGAVKT